MPSHQIVSAIIENRRRHWNNQPLRRRIASYGLFEIHTDYRHVTGEYRIALTITDRRTGWQAARQIDLDRFACENQTEAEFCNMLDHFIETGKYNCEEYFLLNNPTPQTADNLLGRRTEATGALADMWVNMPSSFGTGSEELTRIGDYSRRADQNISRTETAKKKPAHREVRLEKKEVPVPEHSVVRRIRIRLV